MKNKNKLTILSGDAGLVNFALCITQYKRGNLKILKTQMLKQKHIVKNLVAEDVIKRVGPKKKREKIVVPGNRKATKRYIKKMTQLIDKYNPDEIVIERFQNRGFRGGQSIVECVSFMLGCLAAICESKGIPYTWLIASQWKNAVNREVSLDKMYEQVKKHKIEPHQLDALFQGMYVAQKYNLYTYKRLKRERAKVLNHFVEKVLCKK